MGIDVSMCCFYWAGLCEQGGITKKCSDRNCYYKQLQQLKIENELLKNERTIDLRNQLEQLKAENEELKFKLDMQESIGYPLCFTCTVEDCECNKSKLYEECVNEIEKICEMKISDYPMNKIVEITQLIIKVRETINE